MCRTARRAILSATIGLACCAFPWGTATRCLADDSRSPEAGAAPKADSAKDGEARDDLSKAERDLIQRTNDERKKQKLPALTMDPQLMSVARRHTANMARLNKLSHELEGKNFVQRMEDAGYKSLRSGENVAEGYPTPEAAIAGWMTSPGHKANILNGDYTQVGVGIVKEKSDRFFYTQVFAKPFPKP